MISKIITLSVAFSFPLSAVLASDNDHKQEEKSVGRQFNADTSFMDKSLSMLESAVEGGIRGATVGIVVGAVGGGVRWWWTKPKSLTIPEYIMHSVEGYFHVGRGAGIGVLIGVPVGIVWKLATKK